MSRKAKLNVHRFVEVMTGGKLVMEDGKEGARALSYEALQKLQALQAQLQAENVRSAELENAIAAYHAAMAQVHGQTDRAVRERLLERLLVDTRQALKRARADVARWLAQARQQTAAVDGCRQKIEVQRARLKDMALPGIRQAIGDWLQALDARVDAAPTTNVVELTVAQGRLTRLDQEIDALDLDRYYTLAARLAGQHQELSSGCTLMAAAVSKLQDGPLRTLWQNRLAQIRARQQVLQGPVQDLPGLVDRSQELGDLVRELGNASLVGQKAMLDRYEATADALRQQMQQDLDALDRMPDVPLKTALKDACGQRMAEIAPPDLGNGMQGLDQSMALLLAQKIRYDKDQMDRDNIRANVDAYLDFERRAQARVQALMDEADRVDPPAARQAVARGLDLLRNQIVPFDALPTANELQSEVFAIERTVERLEAFTVEEYLRLAQACQAALDAEQRAHDEKLQALDNLPDTPARTAMRQTLQDLQGTVPALDTLVTFADIAAATRDVGALEQRVRALDPAVLARQHEEHSQALLTVQAQIDAKVQQLAAGLGPAAQRLLREELMEDLPSLSAKQPVDELGERLKELDELMQKIAARTLPDKPRLAKQIERADQRAAQARAAIAALDSDTLRQHAQQALDLLENNLAQVKIGSWPSNLPKVFYAGTSGKSGRTTVTLNDGERARALDTSLKALNEALKDENGVDAQMLGLQGGARFAAGLCSVNATLVGFGASHRGISAAEALAVHLYTGSEYRAMNANRRGLNPDARLSFLNQVCDQALAKMPEYPAVAWPTYRAESAWSQEVVDKRYGKGRQFTTGVLWSTGARGVVDLTGSSPKFKHVIYGKRGRDVAAMSGTAGEGAILDKGNISNPNSGRGEVLFPADCQFLVEDRTDPDGAPESIRYSPLGSKAIIATRLKEVLHG